MSDFTERDLIQLRLLKEVVDLLSEASIPVWLSGGWALDFVLGDRTREHDDVDLLIFTHDRHVAQNSVAASGFVRLITAFPDEHRHFSKDGERLSLTFVEYDESGRLVTPGRWSDWPYTPDALEGPTCELGGVKCAVLSVDAQLETKLNFSSHRSGAPLRPKDLLDIQRLKALL